MKQRQSLVKTGLLSKIYEATFAIEFGRKGFATRGKAEEGRISYETGAGSVSDFLCNRQITRNSERIYPTPRISSSDISCYFSLRAWLTANV